MFRRALSAAAQKLGYHVVRESLVDLRAQTVFCRKLFAELGIDMVLDVGANTGQYRSFVRYNVGFGGPAVSFEPVPQFAAALSEAAAHDPLWSVRNEALGSTDGVATINVMQSGVFSSFLSPLHTEFVGYLDSNVVANRIEVPMRRLDDIFRDLKRDFGFERPFLKLDTQGFDLAVLEGASESLSQIPAIQTELSWVPIYDKMPPASEVIRYLELRDFRIAGSYRTAPTGYPTQMLESDGYFVRRR
jgi:FkbM family methyltransferase